MDIITVDSSKFRPGRNEKGDKDKCKKVYLPMEQSARLTYHKGLREAGSSLLIHSAAMKLS